MDSFYTKPSEEVLTNLGSSAEGLSEEEARKRLSEHGANALKEGKKRPLILKFFDQFKDVMIIVLLVAAVVSGVISVVRKEYSDLIDSGLILLIVIVNAIIGLVQENKAEKSLEALKNLNKQSAKVMRNGKLERIKSEDIVPGDIVVLEAGDIVPADMRLLTAASLKIEESALTGESVPVDKTTEPLTDENAPLGDRVCMAYSSGVVSFGHGAGVVVATGMNTEVGKIAEMLSEDTDSDTPLQKQLAKTAKVLSIAVLAIAAVIFIASLITGIVTHNDILDTVVDGFMTAVAIAVAAIPEGLPAVVTIVLSIGVKSMSERNAIVKNLPAVETLGCCEVICSDKTGTLTLNQMTVKELYTADKGVYTAEDAVTGSADVLRRGMCLCNDTIVNGEKLLGDPTETALIAYSRKSGGGDPREKYPRLDEIPFDSKRKLMSTLNDVDGEHVLNVKGAPDILIERCVNILDGDVVRPITDDDKRAITSANSAMAVKALRVLAVAMRDETQDKEAFEKDLTFVGLVGMIDPPRAEVKDAVATCKKAGMRAIMITGDHAVTAGAIAKEVGILYAPEHKIITGAELDKLSDEEYLAHIDEYRVYARVSPENKVRIVKAYRSLGKVVAMTGDGVNDAPSIKAADIGVGMGITGTDVSKGASDMVLADDNFATIVSAVEEGRKVYSNIKKAIQYLLSANIAEVLCLFITVIVLSTIAKQSVIFLTPVMILWVNLVTDSLPALALGMEKAESDVMNYPPRKTDTSLFAGKTGKDIIIQGIMQTALVMGSFLCGYLYFEKLPGAGHEVSETMAFVTLCVIQLFHAYNMKSQNNSIFNKKILDNKLLNISFIVGFALVVLAVAIPGVGESLFGTKPLDGVQWAVSLGFAIAVIPFVELQKLIERKLAKK